MLEITDLAEKIFSLLKGNNFKIQIYDQQGTEVVDPSLGRRFFVLNPNIMITINEEDNCIEFNKGKSVDNDIGALQDGIKRLADEFLMNSAIKVYGKSIHPRDYAYQAKIQKDSVMENSKINSLILGKVFKELDYAAGMTADALSKSIPGSDLNHVQLALNKLVQDGKVEILSQLNGENVYGKKVEEAIDTISESFSKMFGSRKTSRQTLENVKILIKHKAPIDEEVKGSRSRHISAIFLECNGERFRFQENYLPGARAMAQHLAHGGTMNDKVGAFITESTSNLLKLRNFNRYITNNNLINESSSDIVETINENILTLKSDLKKLSGFKTYETARARLETFEKDQLSENDITYLKDVFTIRRFDEKFEDILPIVKQMVQEKDTYNKRIEEAASNTIFLSRKNSDTTPIFEFASDHAKLGFRLNELSLRIVENDELAGFFSKIGTKISKGSKISTFESAVVRQALGNLKMHQLPTNTTKDIKESSDLEAFFDRYTYNFL